MASEPPQTPPRRDDGALPPALRRVAEDAMLLPWDPKVVAGVLGNGMRVVVRPHTYPPGRLMAYLDVHAGSMNEGDSERGLAHVVRHPITPAPSACFGLVFAVLVSDCSRKHLIVFMSSSSQFGVVGNSIELMWLPMCSPAWVPDRAARSRELVGCWSTAFDHDGAGVWSTLGLTFVLRLSAAIVFSLDV